MIPPLPGLEEFPVHIIATDGRNYKGWVRKSLSFMQGMDE
jgi:hypothetical protein